MSPANQMEVSLVTCVEPTPIHSMRTSGLFKQELVALRPCVAGAMSIPSTNLNQYFWRIKCSETSTPQDLIREFNLLNDLKKSSNQSIVAPTKCANFSTDIDSFFLIDLAQSISDCPEFLLTNCNLQLKLKCLHSILLAIQAIHAMGMVHLQILPENILMIQNPHEKIVRFQLQCFPFLAIDDTKSTLSQHQWYSSNELDDDLSSESTAYPDFVVPSHHESMQLSHYPHTFSAPESRNSPYSSRSNTAQNVFSFGCIAYYVLSNGYYPFYSSTSQQDAHYCASYQSPELFQCQVKTNILKTIGKSDSSFHQSFVQLIADALMPVPSNRPALETILSHPLFL